jgi:hypothetical protein
MARSSTEHALIMRCARIGRAAQQLATADRRSEEAEQAVRLARDEAVRAIVDAAPLLTAEQREQLRPILAGSIEATAELERAV